jgi:hypothetical protein
MRSSECAIVAFAPVLISVQLRRRSPSGARHPSHSPANSIGGAFCLAMA